MAINPNIVLGIKPNPTIDPLAIMTKAAAYRNQISETAYRDQQTQTNQQNQARLERQNAAADRDLEAQKAEGELMVANTGEGGEVDHPKVAQGLAAKGFGKQASTYVTRVQIPSEKARLENQTAQVTNGKKQLDAMGAALQSLSQTPDEALAATYDQNLQQLTQQGLMKPDSVPTSQQIMQQGGLPALRAFVTQHAAAAIDADKQVTEHQADLTYALNLKDKQASWLEKKPETAKKWTDEAARSFGAATSPDQWRLTQKTLLDSGAPMNIVSQFGEFGPDAAARATQLGMTPEQKTTAAETASRNAFTQQHQLVEEKQGAGRLAVEQGNLALRQKQMGGTLGSLTPAQKSIAQKLADGDFNPSELGRFPDKEALIAGALELNPDWTRQTYSTKKAFTDPASKQSQNLGTISRIVEHIGSFEKNSDKLGVSPSMLTGTNLTGDAAAVHADAHAIASELEKLVSGGVGTVGQVKEWQSALTSSRPGIRKAAIDEISQLAGGQFTSMNQSYKAGTGKDLPLDKFTSEDSRAWLQKNGINVTGAASGGAPEADPAFKAYADKYFGGDIEKAKAHNKK